MKHLLRIALVTILNSHHSMVNAEFVIHCAGQGPLVHLIGGGPAFTTWNLEPIQKRLSVKYRVCRWDMRGVGENAGLPVDSQTTALSQWLQDMHAILPGDPVTLWGHSWGALQVLLFAQEYPGQVKRLILSNPVDPALRSLERIEEKRFNHPELDAGLTLDDIGTPVEELHNLRSKIASYFVDAWRGWKYASGFSQADSNNRLNIRIWQEYRNRPLTDLDMQQLAGRINGVIYCRNDVLQPENLTEYQRVLVNNKHHVLKGCAHFPWEENPDEYYRVLFELLRE